MSAAERVTITMPTDMAETLCQTVASGGYASTSEIVREALRNRNSELRDLEARRAAIKGGPGIPVDEVFAEMRDRCATRS